MFRRKKGGIAPPQPEYIWDGDISGYEAHLREQLSCGDVDALSCTVEQLIGDIRRHKGEFLEKAALTRRLILQQQPSERYQEILKKLFDAHSIDEFSYDQFNDVGSFRFPIMQVSSLWANFVRRRRMKQIGQVPDRWLTYNKTYGETFAKMCGIRVPKSTHGVPFDEIPRKSDIVIKPVHGSESRGVYIVRSEKYIWSVAELKVLRSWEELKKDVLHSLEKGIISENLFAFQECIYSDRKKKIPAHDLKFYSFYGQIGAILEVARYPRRAYWWWNPDGTPIELEDHNPPNLHPWGVSKKELALAKKLSLKIPSPFMRLDFLQGEDALYFDEFCSMSGFYGAIKLENYKDTFNRRFGNMYLKAEMRIINDLLDGKRFDEITEFNRICAEKHT